ncbi:putative hemolysin [Anseongella ginsenosidimutans]|uniref:Putative hemolysin n=1 Tax=Anseongella ginsenosidimutans TaxID=496056 RepID=A0A4R3KNH8_9SPHI|nr:hemolysin family protein [Anseongella ginsenosidimutans]QEC53690.1 HlyC/CorC family transporter [Anseongella ginsenosidimutans]TCS86061.1 putative hemolysin [Anseongella ginsenosidimutans]
MLAEVFIILFLILLNGIFAASEIALVSSRKTRLELFIKKGNRAATEAMKLHRSPNKFLSTVQIGITLISILTGLYSGAAFAPFFKQFFVEIPLLAPYSENISVALVVIIITFLTLVFGELVPKRVGLIIPEKFAMAVAWPMTFLGRMVAPFVWLLSTTTDLIIRLFNIRSDKNQVTEEEIKALVEEGVSAGAIEEIEHQIVDRVFNLGDKRVLNLMTYRSDIVWLDINEDPELHKKTILESNHNVYPVCDGEIDNILGIVTVKKLLNIYLGGENPGLKSLLSPASFIHETASAYQVLRQFRQNKTHHAFIIDEYGSLEGMITLNDLLYTLVGTISGDGFSGNEKVQREDGSWLIDGQYPLTDFLQEFDLSAAADEIRGVNTLAGFMILQLRRLPQTGEKLTWNDLELEIMDMDGRRIDKILVRIVKKGEE